MELRDHHERLLASDPAQSFIVQAPAGSGKTELLTQRFLRLLSTVNNPEQVVALTFTRKAASEMRERILLNLQRAANGEQGSSPHQRLTYDYAQTALLQDKKQQWQLLNHPGRLRILTLDSLCQSLTRSIPLQHQHISFADIKPEAENLYRQAARNCLQEAMQTETLQDTIRILLMHLDNKQEDLISLLCNLLAKRDQWLEVVFTARQQDKRVFETALETIEAQELANFKASIPPQHYQSLQRLCQQVAVLSNEPESARFALCAWDTHTALTADIAKGMSALLLTDKKLRVQFDHNVLKKECCEETTRKNIKAESKVLLDDLRLYPDFCDKLIRMKNLPKPQYDEQQWDVLQALLRLLPRLLAHLQLVFCANNQVDFTAVSQQALLALGDEDNPTDLALYLDYAIQHLLLDEFQDTSIQQFQLISRLVSGWQEGDGRTLFIVGDPMQSIYRFRQAEVGLFLKAKQQGIGSVPLKSLQLCSNFRSLAPLVNWCNQLFHSIFPAQDEMEMGAIAFHPSQAIKESTSDECIYAIQTPDRQQEALSIAACIAHELAQDEHSTIAILVRSRSQLRALIPVLRAKKIAFQGVDIEQLSSLPHIQDHWSLCNALLMPADRVSWLALLRSPWCGFKLDEVYLIANYNKKESILYALSHAASIEGLSAESIQRAEFIYSVLLDSLHQRHQFDLVQWVSKTSERLFTNHILNETQQQDLEQFWQLLMDNSEQGILSDRTNFMQKLQALYSQRTVPARLQIMTIHKSKGLEFDLVILPGLSSKSNRADKSLLRWLKLPSHSHDNLFLLSPIQACNGQGNDLYDYLGKIDKEKSHFELQRLLYVAVTRAKKRLYLFDNQESNEESKAPEGSFRAFLSAHPFDSCSENDLDSSATTLPQMYRLPQSYYINKKVDTLQSNPLPPLQLSSARIQGVVTHELLQYLCNKHVQNVSLLPWEYVNKVLHKAGLDENEQDLIKDLIRLQLQQFLNDPIGQWICRKHADEQNEFAYLVMENGQVSTRIIDRTFCEEGIRWIIDFKTGIDDVHTQIHHRKQVENYARHFQLQEDRTIKCGVYYLSNNSWQCWDYEMQKAIDFLT